MSSPLRLPLPALLAVLSLGGACNSTTAKDAAELRSGPGVLTVERIVDDATLQPERFGRLRWLDGSRYTTVEDGDLVARSAETGEGRVLVTAQQLTPVGADEPLEVESYEWSDDRTKMLIFTNTRRVWRTNTRGDYWVLDLSANELAQVGADKDEARLMFAKFSPDGTRVAYVYYNDIWVEDHASGEVRQLTTDGSDTIINGTFDWVYEEEFRLRDGFRWSPDGEWIAYWQLDCSEVGEFLLIDNTSGIYSKTIALQYPKAGTTNSACRVGVMSAASGETVWMQTPGDPRNTYLAGMEWAASSNALLVQHLNRNQDHLQGLLCDARTGEVRTILEERDDAWIDVRRGVSWIDEGPRFLWTSERDGWRHAWVHDLEQGEGLLVTDFEHDVVSVQHVDADWLYYLASPDDPGQRYLYRISMGGGEPERLSPADQPGSHSYDMSPDASWAVHTYSSFGGSPVVSMVSLPDHEVARVIVDNAENRAALEALDRGGHELFRVTGVGADGRETGLELDGWVMYPPDFDPSRSWPVLFHVYGEPAAQTVRDVANGRHWLWHLLMTQRGYVVMSVDNRGTPAPRGREWRKSIHEKIGVVSSEDQAAALRAIQRRWDWVDPERIGIWGWSGGGSMTLNMLFREPELYAMGVSVAPVADLRLYDTIYQERYMGLPQDNPDEYAASSPITHAANLVGDLLLIHGTGDDNVHYQGTEYLIDVLVEHHLPFELMAYPNRTHGIREGEGTRRHLYELMTRFVEEHLEAGPR